MKNWSSRKWTKGLLMVVPVMIVVAALCIFAAMPKSNAITLEGSVEISTNSCFAQTSGTVTEVMVQAGQQVKAGDVLAVMDDSGLQNQVQQLEATLVMKNAKLNQLKKMPDAAPVIAARKAAQHTAQIYQEKLTAARRSLEEAEAEYNKQQQLYDAGAIAQQQLKQYQQSVETASTAVAVAESELAAAQNTVNTYASPEQDADAVDAALADIHLTELQIEQLEQSKDDYTVKALTDGVVISSDVAQGVTVVQGQRLFDVSNQDDKQFVFYLPVEYADEISFGSKVDIYRLNAAEPIGTANVCYMDWKAVYTPDDYESGANKNKKSIKVKALIDSAEPLGVGETLVTRIEKETAE